MKSSCICRWRQKKKKIRSLSFICNQLNSLTWLAALTSYTKSWTMFHRTLFSHVISVLLWRKKIFSYIFATSNGNFLSKLVLTCVFFLFFFLSFFFLLQNVEAEKQVKFFQGCVASAFAERDHAIMEVIKIISISI